MVNFMKQAIEKKTKVLPAALLCAVIAFPDFSWGVDFTGHWTGSRTSYYYGSYSLTSDLSQTGTSLSGSFTTASDCGNALSNISLTGSVSGDSASFQSSYYCNADSAWFSLSFTNGVISGNALSGSYTVCLLNDPLDCVDSGTFALTTSTYRLTVSTSGTGSGSVSSDPNGISSCSTSCSSNFNATSHVILTATPDTGSVFTSWSVAGCSAPGACTVTMNAAKNVTATFSSSCADRLVKIGGKSFYEHIQDAYNEAADGESVQMQAVDFNEDLTMQNVASVTLQGGFDCAYTSNPDWTTINGTLTFSGGPVTVENLIIE